MRFRSSPTAPLVVLLMAGILVSGCASSGGSAPETVPSLPEESSSAETSDEPVQPSVEPEPIEAPPEEPPTAAEEEPSGAWGPKTVVVQGPEEESHSQPQTLAEAARRAREQRGDDAEPIAVITDETLSDFATGELTVATEPAATTPPASESSLSDLAAEEEYWRTRVRDARLAWRDLVDEVAELEGEVGKLRTRFYAEDDGYFRDSQIKPAWDRALDRLSETQAAVAAAQDDLQSILEEGRRAGALPGWLREGMQYEPAADGRGDGIRPHEPGEPVVVEEDDGP